MSDTMTLYIKCKHNLELRLTETGDTDTSREIERQMGKFDAALDRAIEREIFAAIDDMQNLNSLLQISNGA